MWSLPEIREILKEVGFKESHVYWEGTDEDGEGDGVFTRTGDWVKIVSHGFLISSELSKLSLL